MNHLTIDSPVGALTLFAKEEYIVSIQFKAQKRNYPTDILKKTKAQLSEYFLGERKHFTVPIRLGGTHFQKSVWYLISKIPKGKTKTYGQLAKEYKTSPRAIGYACKVNPIPIIIPCHRVIGLKNDLKGYSGGQGQKTKRQLLLIEGYRVP